MIKRSQNKWISHQRITDKGEINLLCFVFAGGSPSFFAPWKNSFPEWVNFIPVLYPQREKRASENMPDSVEELIASFLTDNKHLTDKPYVIWGHCSGALIGMEIAVADISNGHRPAGFIISGCEAPEHALQRLQFRDEDFSEVPDEGILGDLIHFNLMPEDMVRDPIFQKYFLPIYRADLSMFSKYTCRTNQRFDFPAIILNGHDDKMINPEKIRGWSDQFTGKVEYSEYPGEHYFVNDACNKELIRNEIIEFLETIRK